ncbi:MAG: outer membrane lipid asymmetry maintenance protein MlaD [Deltaproteobacteria bacterium]|jgi:phospholipid/cholesterol/gamma-HCH transport system substrate-binding protein|nr:outer membrane lipid asymmetry maintenance protein MlaD [Deltaproteobacteria bacterium]
MPSETTRDLTVGLFVLAGLAALAYLSIQLGGLTYKGPRGLQLHASFDEIGGLAPRAPVVISGVPVGEVVEITLDEDLRARVEIDVDAALELAVDTSASIRTSGLLGDQFVALEPGGEDELLGPGDTLSFTESALNIEKLVGTLVHDTGLGGGE